MSQDPGSALRQPVTDRGSFAFRRWALLFLLCLLLVGLTLGAYEPARHNQFVNYDDDRYVTDNPQVQAGLTSASIRWAFTTTEMVNWHPLTWLSFQANHQLHQLRPLGYHLTNVLLHT